MNLCSDIFCFSLKRLIPKKLTIWSFWKISTVPRVLTLSSQQASLQLFLNYLFKSSPVQFPIHFDLLQSCNGNSMVLVTKWLVETKPISNMEHLQKYHYLLNLRASSCLHNCNKLSEIQIASRIELFEPRIYVSYKHGIGKAQQLIFCNLEPSTFTLQVMVFSLWQIKKKREKRFKLLKEGDQDFQREINHV